VVKAQVLAGGRGKAGGIKVANSHLRGQNCARAILGMDIRGEKSEAAAGGRGRRRSIGLTDMLLNDFVRISQMARAH